MVEVLAFPAFMGPETDAGRNPGCHGLGVFDKAVSS